MESLLPGTNLGRYEIEGRIGRGGMASVYRARDPELGRTVAVKVLPSLREQDPSFIERFRNEAQAIASLRHPNIVQVFDFGEDSGFNYIVMEHVDGGTLHDLLNRQLPLDEVLTLVRPLAEALDYAHGQGIIHRDIKPANVLLDANRNPILSDFGLARVMEATGGLTRVGSLVGTPEYIAPEQARGRPAVQKSDLYALAIVIYQMMLGRTPFRGDTPLETVMAHAHEPVPQPTALDPDFDPRVETVVLKGLAKDPDRRYETATELVDALAAAPAAPKSGVSPSAWATLVAPASSAGMVLQDEEGKEFRFDEAGQVVGGYLSLDQARVLAIRHARENSDFYGPRYADRELAWEAVDAEDGEDYYHIRLHYRPAREFHGAPGTELFTIDKAGPIELRQILHEPVERRRLRVPRLAASVAVVTVLAVGGLVATVVLASRPQEVGLPGAPGAAEAPVTVSAAPDAPTQLVSPRKDVTVDVDVGSVETTIRLTYQSLSAAEAPPLPVGFVTSQKIFDLSVAGDDAQRSESFQFMKPITVTVRLSSEDVVLAGAVESNVVIQHYSQGESRWVALQTGASFGSMTARRG